MIRIIIKILPRFVSRALWNAEWIPLPESVKRAVIDRMVDNVIFMRIRPEFIIRDEKRNDN